MVELPERVGPERLDPLGYEPLDFLSRDYHRDHRERDLSPLQRSRRRGGGGLSHFAPAVGPTSRTPPPFLLRSADAFRTGPAFSSFFRYRGRNGFSKLF